MEKQESLVLFFDWEALRKGFFETLQEEYTVPFVHSDPCHGSMYIEGHRVDVSVDDEKIRQDLSGEHWRRVSARMGRPLLARLTYERSAREILQKAMTPYLSDILIDEGRKDLVWSYGYRHGDAGQGR